MISQHNVRAPPLHWVPSTELHPSGAQLHICIAIKATRFDAKVWDTGDGELKSLGDAEIHVAPCGVSVAACQKSACVSCVKQNDTHPSGRQSFRFQQMCFGP